MDLRTRAEAPNPPEDIPETDGRIGTENGLCFTNTLCSLRRHWIQTVSQIRTAKFGSHLECALLARDGYGQVNPS